MKKYLSYFLPGIKYLILRVTNKCNAECSFCLNRYYQSATDSNCEELSVDEYVDIARNIKGLLLLNLSGGEPYLRKDLFDIANAFIVHSHARLISSPTNGSFPERTLDFAEKVLGHHRNVVLKIGISIDGIGAQHDTIRGLPAGYDNALETARLLKGLKNRYSNLLVFAVTTVTSANVHQLESIRAEFSRIGLFDDHFLTLVRGPSSETQLTGDEFELYRHAYLTLTAGKKSSASAKEAVNKAINALAFQELVTSRHHGSNSFRCLAGEKMINVSEQGDVCICEMHSNPLLGNLRDHGYDIQRILQLPSSVDRLSKIGKNSCNCHWDCAIFCSLLFGGVFGYKKIVSTLVKGKN